MQFFSCEFYSCLNRLHNGCWRHISLIRTISGVIHKQYMCSYFGRVSYLNRKIKPVHRQCCIPSENHPQLLLFMVVFLLVHRRKNICILHSL
jgi:hypothetical protein